MSDRCKLPTTERRNELLSSQRICGNYGETDKLSRHFGDEAELGGGASAQIFEIPLTDPRQGTRIA